MFFLSSKLHATFFRLSFFLSIVCFSRIVWVNALLKTIRSTIFYFSCRVTFFSFLRFVFEERSRSIFEQNRGRFWPVAKYIETNSLWCNYLVTRNWFKLVQHTFISILNIFARIQFVISKISKNSKIEI